MDSFHKDPTSQKLMRAFMQFEKSSWHQRSIAGCKPSEIKVLFCIKRSMRPDVPTMKVSDISKFLHVTSPTVTQLIKGLEANGLVERHIDQTDRRAIDIQLTEKGEIVTQQAANDFYCSFKGLIEYLGEEQSNQLADLLSKVFLYFNEKEANFHTSQWSGDEE